jgi:hypothetical protein
LPSLAHYPNQGGPRAAELDWLSSRAVFLRIYQEPNFNGVGVLKVLNEDRRRARQRIRPRSHRDMQIPTYESVTVWHTATAVPARVLGCNELHSASSGRRHVRDIARVAAIRHLAARGMKAAANVVEPAIAMAVSDITVW